VRAVVAAAKAPVLPPVELFTSGFGLTGGFEKAEDAPLRAASRTLYCVSPGVWLVWEGFRVLFTPFIEPLG